MICFHSLIHSLFQSLTFKTVQKIPNPNHTKIRAESITLSFVVLAHAFKWNAAGKIKATGVQDTEPRIAKNLSVF